MRAAGAVEELEVEVDRLAVAAEADRQLALHLVEVERLVAVVAGGAADRRAGPGRDVALRARPGWW